jgi:hypothetical protein
MIEITSMQDENKIMKRKGEEMTNMRKKTEIREEGRMKDRTTDEKGIMVLHLRIRDIFVNGGMNVLIQGHMMLVESQEEEVLIVFNHKKENQGDDVVITMVRESQGFSY